jgi:predicted Fe-Mo cluster-binding NifX family protein
MSKNSVKSVLIAIPTNNETTLFPKMLGMAKYFHIYSTTDGKQFTFVEKRINPYEKTMQHLKTLDVYSVIRDCDIIIAALIGKKGIERLKERGIKLFFIKGEIDKALNNVFSNGINTENINNDNKEAEFSQIQKLVSEQKFGTAINELQKNDRFGQQKSKGEDIYEIFGKNN